MAPIACERARTSWRSSPSPTTRRAELAGAAALGRRGTCPGRGWSSSTARSSDDSVAVARRSRGGVDVDRAGRERRLRRAPATAGSARSRAPVTALLNPDVELLDDSLLALAAELRRDDRPERLLAPLVLNPDGTRQDTVHPVPGSRPDLVRALVSPAAVPGGLGDGARAVARRAPRRVGWAVGCALVARTETLRRLGPFDERIFLYGEDLELGLRAASAGVETWFWPAGAGASTTAPTRPSARSAASRSSGWRGPATRWCAAGSGGRRAAARRRAQALTFASRIGGQAGARPAGRARAPPAGGRAGRCASPATAGRLEPGARRAATASVAVVGRRARGGCRGRRSSAVGSPSVVDGASGSTRGRASTSDAAPGPPAPPPPTGGEQFGVNVNRLFNDPGLHAGADRRAAGGARRPTGATIARSDALWEAASRRRRAAASTTTTGASTTGSPARSPRTASQWLPILDYSAPWAQSIPGQDHSAAPSPRRLRGLRRRVRRPLRRRAARSGASTRLPAAPGAHLRDLERARQPGVLGARPRTPAAYADLYLAARDAIAAGQPGARVIVGGLTNPARVPAGDAARAAAAARPHRRRRDPPVRPAARSWCCARSGRRAPRWTRSGWPSVPLYVTEFGWTTHPPGALDYAPGRAAPGLHREHAGRARDTSTAGSPRRSSTRG